jgi:hypothetical protein
MGIRFLPRIIMGCYWCPFRFPGEKEVGYDMCMNGYQKPIMDEELTEIPEWCPLDEEDEVDG